MSIYSDVKATGGYISNHASDLYIEVNEVNRAILKRNGVETVPTFRNQVTGKLCYDVAFAYDPFWEAKARPVASAIVRRDAVAIARLQADGDKAGSRAGFTHDEWRWFAILAALQCKTWRIVGPVEGGVADCVYLHAEGVDDLSSGGFEGKLRSRVVALPRAMIESESPGELTPPPVEPREATGPGAWWKAKGLDVVRLATSWVDGFMAFTPHKD